MRKHSKFGALLLCAALGFSVSLESCKDYDDDIENLQLQIDETKADLKALQDKIAAGAVITSVNSTAEGIVVTLSDGKSYTITNGKDGINGTNGKDGKDGVNGLSPIIGLDENGNLAYRYSDTEEWKTIAPMPTISADDFEMEIKDGHLFINGEDLGQVVGADGKPGADGVGVESIFVENNKLMWEDTKGNKHEITGTIDFTKILNYTRDEEGKLIVNGLETGLFIPEVYMTVEGDYYVLHMPVKENGQYVLEDKKIKYSQIKLPTAAIVTLQQITMIPFSTQEWDNYFTVTDVTGVKQASWSKALTDDDYVTYNHKFSVRFRVYPENYRVKNAENIKIIVDQVTKAKGAAFNNIEFTQPENSNLVTLTADWENINKTYTTKDVFSIVIDGVSSQYFNGSYEKGHTFDASNENDYEFKLKFDEKYQKDKTFYNLGYKDTKGLVFPFVFVDNKNAEYPEFTTTYTIEPAAEQPTGAGFLSAEEITGYFVVDGMTIKAKDNLGSGDAIGKKAQFLVWAKINEAVIGMKPIVITLGTKSDVIEEQEPVDPETPVIPELSLQDVIAFQTTGDVKTQATFTDAEYVEIANKLETSKAEAMGLSKEYTFKDSKGNDVITITGRDKEITFNTNVIAGKYTMTVAFPKGGETVLNVIKNITVTYPVIEIEKVQGWWDGDNCTVQGRLIGGLWQMEMALDEVLKLKNAGNNEELSFEVTDEEAIATLEDKLLTLDNEVDLSKNNILNFKAIITNKAGVVISETAYKVAFKNPLPYGLTAKKNAVTLYNKEGNNTINLAKAGEKAGIGINLESAIADHKAVVTDGVVAENNVFNANIEFKLEKEVKGLSVDPATGELTWTVTATGAVFTQIDAKVIVTVTTPFGTKTMPIEVTILGADEVPAE